VRLEHKSAIEEQGSPVSESAESNPLSVSRNPRSASSRSSAADFVKVSDKGRVPAESLVAPPSATSLHARAAVPSTRT